MNEQFSAFLDGEATRDEADSILNSLLEDEAMKDSWSRCHWIRTSLRSHEAEPRVDLDEGFVDRVMTAVARDEHGAEPAESAVRKGHHRKRARIIRMPGRMSHRWKGVANVAAAASVAGVVLVSGASFMNDGGMSADEQVADTGDGQLAEQTSEAESRRRHTFASADGADRLEDVDAVSSRADQNKALASGGIAGDDDQARTRQVAQTSHGAAHHWSVSDPDVRHELNGYLAYHSGMARGYGMPSTAPTMMRVAGYGQGDAR